ENVLRWALWVSSTIRDGEVPRRLRPFPRTSEADVRRNTDFANSRATSVSFLSSVLAFSPSANRRPRAWMGSGREHQRFRIEALSGVYFWLDLVSIFEAP